MFSFFTGLPRTVRKFFRDAAVMLAALAVGVLVNEWTSIIESVQGMLPADNQIPAAYLALALSGVLAVYRELRDRAGQVDGPADE